MNPISLRIYRHDKTLPLPGKAHPTDSGIDIYAASLEWATHLGLGLVFVNTGISIEVGEGYYCEVVLRSSMVRSGFFMANGVGVIDADYRGEIKVPLGYWGTGSLKEEGEALLGQRVAQLLVRKLEPVSVEEATAPLSQTARGSAGFGSTGTGVERKQA